MAKYRGLRQIFVGAASVAALLAPCISGAAERPPAALQEMRAKFAAAVAAKNLQAAMEMTHFPLKNDVYSEPQSISRAAFPKGFGAGGPYLSLKDCLKSSPLELDTKAKTHSKPWLINCDGNIFYFASFNGVWLHSEYQNINE